MRIYLENCEQNIQIPTDFYETYYGISDSDHSFKPKITSKKISWF